MRGGDQFKITSVFDDTHQKWERVQVAVCGCGRTETVHDGGLRAKPPEAMAAKFRLKGWRIAPRRSGDQCPACAAGKPRKPRKPKAALSPQQKRAAYCRIAGVKPASPASPIEPQEPKEAKMSTNAPVAAPVAADPPRTPTREDWRRIRDALDTRYLEKQGCYAKDFTDRRLADQLAVPWAWVAEERERVYGPDRCEADGQDAAKIEALLARGQALERDGLELATKAEALNRDLVALKLKMAQRGVS